jgi:hypothetical protein
MPGEDTRPTAEFPRSLERGSVEAVAGGAALRRHCEAGCQKVSNVVVENASAQKLSWWQYMEGQRFQIVGTGSRAIGRGGKPTIRAERNGVDFPRISSANRPLAIQKSSQKMRGFCVANNSIPASCRILWFPLSLKLFSLDGGTVRGASSTADDGSQVANLEQGFNPVEGAISGVLMIFNAETN